MSVTLEMTCPRVVTLRVLPGPPGSVGGAWPSFRKISLIVVSDSSSLSVRLLLRHFHEAHEAPLQLCRSPGMLCCCCCPVFLFTCFSVWRFLLLYPLVQRCSYLHTHQSLYFYIFITAFVFTFRMSSPIGFPPLCTHRMLSASSTRALCARIPVVSLSSLVSAHPCLSGCCSLRLLSHVLCLRMGLVVFSGQLDSWTAGHGDRWKEWLSMGLRPVALSGGGGRAFYKSGPVLP